MIEQSEHSVNNPGRTGQFIDMQLERFATVLDRLRLDLARPGDNGKPTPMANSLASKLNAASGKLRSTKGEDVVDLAKDQIARHPAIFTAAAAVVGVAIAQLAVAAVRKDRLAPRTDAVRKAPA